MFSSYLIPDLLASISYYAKFHLIINNSNIVAYGDNV